MSTERRRRRAERERLKAAAAAERERREARQRRRRDRLATLRGLLPRRTRWSRSTGRLARRRRRGYAVLAAVFVGVQAVAWTLSPDWYLRLGVLLVCLLVAPLVAGLVVGRPGA
jgi:Flp pilus assembly protein TadB